MTSSASSFMFVRGRVYYAVTDERVGEKPFLVVSNNGRNRALKSALVVRVTTSDKPVLASIVELAHEDQPMHGRVLCDDIFELWPDEVTRDAGALSQRTMMRVADGLRAALAL